MQDISREAMENPEAQSTEEERNQSLSSRAFLFPVSRWSKDPSTLLVC